MLLATALWGPNLSAAIFFNYFVVGQKNSTTITLRQGWVMGQAYYHWVNSSKPDLEVGIRSLLYNQLKSGLESNVWFLNLVTDELINYLNCFN